jgi:hypothetical protein
VIRRDVSNVRFYDVMPKRPIVLQWTNRSALTWNGPIIVRCVNFVTSQQHGYLGQLLNCIRILSSRISLVGKEELIEVRNLFLACFEVLFVLKTTISGCALVKYHCGKLIEKPNHRPASHKSCQFDLAGVPNSASVPKQSNR